MQLACLKKEALGMTLEIYYKPKRSVKREQAFADALIAALKPDQIIESYYPLSEELAHKCVEVAPIIKWAGDSELSQKMRSKLLPELRKLPKRIRVVIDTKLISCDVVVVKNGVPSYLEFHEQQHRNLRSARATKIYAEDGTPIVVPRFVQRLLRDVWRATHLRPFTAVWYDYFDLYGVNGIVPLQNGYQEYFLPDKFKFMPLADSAESANSIHQ